ncbi:MAG: tetratricopeptide repeat protein [Burkholderiaceae bacterium]|nr:tetratricopeptide repeat protein [Burkholderiaceae bacterium]
MSLINQMLKDLDKRGSGVAGGEAASGTVRVVQEQGRSRRLAVLVVIVLLVLGAAAGWYFWQGSTAPQVQPAMPPQMASAEVPKPAMPTVPAVAAVPAPTVLEASQPVNPSAGKETRSAPTAPGKFSPTTSEPPAAAQTERVMKLAMSNTLDSIHAPEPSHPKAAAKGSKKRGGGEAPGVQLKETTAQQHAENAYGKAIALIGAGQKTEAISALETILLSHPKHAAARQTLVGLLLDAKRSGEAARVLEEGLTLDPKQTGMAMILARLQIEQGGSAVALATLQRSLPYAVNRPDYLAFTAAMLQREKRHREAVTHFAHALRKSPQNAHWWMGYGVSLQALGQPKEARQAFVHARDLHKLPPELQAYVEQKIGEI